MYLGGLYATNSITKKASKNEQKKKPFRFFTKIYDQNGYEICISCRGSQR